METRDMGWRRCCGFAVAAILVAGAGTSPGAEARRSPFADKPCLSYSSFHSQELRWGDAPLDDFGPMDVRFDFSGIRKLRPAPAPGVHPRIFCGPDDLPDIRRRLKETRCGRAIWNNLLCWTQGMKGAYDERADYARPDLWHGSFGGLHGPVPLFRLGQGGWKSDRYARLVRGDESAEAGFFWSVFPLEAFRCWVEGDRPAAETLAKAVMTALSAELKRIGAERQRKGLTGPRSLALDDVSKGNGLAFTYDFLFNYLTPAQRKAIHDELAATTWYHDNYGTFTNATNTRSNWASFSYWLVQLLAIEGEEGFNDLKYLGLYRAWRCFLTYGFFASGAVLEGEAKDQLGMDGIIAFAMRGTRENLCGHPHLRAQATRFLPLSVTPTSGGAGPFGRAPFLKFDLLGGIGSINPLDAIGLKFMFPDDKVVDWVFRKQVGENYEMVPDRPDGYCNALLFWAICASDFAPANNDPAKLNLGNTFFCGERSLLMTRSSWADDALMLALHVRAAKGGHPYADRNAIALCGAGRAWSVPPTFDGFQNYQNSTVVIDAHPQDLWVPGRMADFNDQPLATFVCGDAKYAWDWKWKKLEGRDKPYPQADVDANRVEIPDGWRRVTESINDFAYTKRPEAAFARPLFELPSWIGVRGTLTPVVCQPNYPVKRAFRTAGLVRGDYPYALVLDDIQKDDAVHHYDWVLAVPDDVQLLRIDLPKKGAKGLQAMDILLAGNRSLATLDDRGQPAKGEPLLLVRVLHYVHKDAAEPVAGLAYMAQDRNRRLVIPADAIAPEFRVMLYPFHQGAPLPQTTWDDKGRLLTVAIGKQRDDVSFDPRDDGRTALRIVREPTAERQGGAFTLPVAPDAPR